MSGPVHDFTGSEQHSTDADFSAPVARHARTNGGTVFPPPSGQSGAEDNQVLSQERLAFLVEAVRKGDQLAFGFLYEQFEHPIRTYLTHLVGDRESVPDLMQDTFFKVWRGLPKIPPDQEVEFRPWLYRIATNTALDYFRRRKRRRLSVQADEAHDENIPDGANFEERVCELECVKQALRGLSKRSRECILMNYVEGYTRCEIAQRLNISEGAVNRYISNGRRRFCELYQQAVEQADRKREK